MDDPLAQRWANYGLRTACGPPEYIMRPVGTFVKTTVNIKIFKISLFNFKTISVHIVKCSMCMCTTVVNMN